MKRLHICSLLIFCVTAVLFFVFLIREKQTEDLLSPEISIDQRLLKVSVRDSGEKLLEGVTAKDAKDGDVTDSLVVEGLSPFLKKDRRLVTYAAFDSDHHVTKDSREIVYTDYHSPRFQLLEPLKFPVGTTELTENLKAEDCLDGDVSDAIKLSPESFVTVDVAGLYKVIYRVSNSAQDISELPVTVEIYENGSYGRTPQISLSDYLVYTEKGKKLEAADYLEQVVIGNEEYHLTDGEESYGQETGQESRRKTIRRERIQISDEVDYETPGTYEIQYSMTSLEGVTGSVRLIVVVRGNES